MSANRTSSKWIGAAGRSRLHNSKDYTMTGLILLHHVGGKMGKPVIPTWECSHIIANLGTTFKWK